MYPLPVTEHLAVKSHTNFPVVAQLDDDLETAHNHVVVSGKGLTTLNESIQYFGHVAQSWAVDFFGKHVGASCNYTVYNNKNKGGKQTVTHCARIGYGFHSHGA